MNCQNCGAGLEPVGNRPYFRCAYCETFHFPNELADGVALVGGAAPRTCPVCADPLARAAIDGHAVEYCCTCRGLLTANATFNQIVQAKRARNGGTAAPALPFDRAELQRRLKCPCCAKPMDAHPYHAGGNAVIDTCHRCYVVWLDAGEVTILGNYTPARPAAPLYAPPLSSSYSDPDPRPVITVFGFPLRLGG
jgi:Zn-finger nucleic acid-binding protein